MNKLWEDWKLEWKIFLSIIFSPIILTFLGLTGILSIYAINLPESNIIRIILSVLIALFGGILGALILKAWEKLTDTPHLIAKGKMAIRSLIHLLTNIIYLEKRIIQNIDSDLDGSGKIIGLHKHLFEDVVDWCKLLQEECKASIENWADIVNEADIKSMITSFLELKSEEEELKKQIEILNQELSQERDKTDKSTGKINELETELIKIEKVLAATKKQMHEKQIAIATSPIGGVDFTTLGTSGASYINMPQKIRCSNCKKLYLELHPYSETQLCQDCKIKLTSGG